MQRSNGILYSLWTYRRWSFDSNTLPRRVVGLQNRGRNPQLAAIATPPPTYQLCKDAEAYCLLVGTSGLLRRRQARPHEADQHELAAARVEELHVLRDVSVRSLSEAVLIIGAPLGFGRATLSQSEGRIRSS